MLLSVHTVNVSANVRAEVARARRTQQDVARAAGMSRGRWYARMRSPEDWTVDELRKVAAVLGVPLSALTGEDR